MEKRIVILNGCGGVGKDYFADLCSKYKKVVKKSTVDEIKIVASLLGWNTTLKDDERSRKFLADLKNLSTNYNDFPFKELLKSIEYFKTDDNELLFLFIREIPEIERMKSLDNNIVTLLLTNSKVKFITSNEADKNVLNYNYDYVISNEGTKEDLDKKAKEFIDSLFNN